MADQTRIRPQQRGPNLPQAPSGAESRFTRRGEDPLAELARLIGQDDPFAEFSNGQLPASRASQQRAGNGIRDDRYGQNGANGARPIERSRKAEATYAPDYEDNEDNHLPRSSVTPTSNGRSAYSYGGTPIERGGVDRLAPPASRAPYQPISSRAPLHEEYEDDGVYEDQNYEHENPNHVAYEDPRIAAVRINDSRRRSNETYDQDYSSEHQEYAEDEYASEDHEQAYVAPPRSSRRWLFVGIAALIGLVVLSVTGIYGYRALYGKHSASTPPTIRSADAPNKVIPQANAEGGGQKLIYDRAPGSSERVVSREEQPADLAQNRGAGRVTAPVADNVQPVGQASAFAPPSEQSAPAQIGPAMTNTNSASGEPKRVRTMTVRSDGSMVANTAAVRPAPQANNQRAANTPLALNPTAPTSEEDPADATANRSPARSATRTTTPAQNSQQPWAIVQQPTPTQAPQQQASNYVPAGSYVVQVSSQKSEADAQTAWRQMQSRYTNVLGSQQASIKRVDLGDRGTFYRAMVGPFTTRDQAYEMCQNLKAAGGECVVQRN
jgi:cell division septation protein DedD